MEALKVFVVEDDKVFAKTLKYHLELNPEYEVEIFFSARECIDNLYKNPSLITLDYDLPGMSGLQFLQWLKEHNKKVPVIVVSGQREVQVAIDILKAGAYDYLVKDQDIFERIWAAISRIKENRDLMHRIDALEDELDRKFQFDKYIKGQSESINKVFSLISKAVKTDISVSITGETGTGKEMVAKAIHFNSKRRKGPFVAVNVSAVPHELIESEMFGHEKGAFTDANSRRIGKFEEASGGTLFLDEIGDMNLNMQTKLLRVLQEGELNRVGGNQSIKLDTRLVTATNKNLLEEVKTGRFREDLYYRIMGLPISLPPLRQRGNDVFILAKFFLDEFCDKNNMEHKRLSTEAQQKLKKYSFPGNVRELKAMMELAAVMADNPVIDENDISMNPTNELDNLLMQETTMREYHKKIIKYYLKKYNNKVRVVAEVLDVGKSSIYNILKDERERGY